MNINKYLLMKEIMRNKRGDAMITVILLVIVITGIFLTGGAIPLMREDTIDGSSKSEVATNQSESNVLAAASTNSSNKTLQLKQLKLVAKSDSFDPNSIMETHIAYNKNSNPEIEISAASTRKVVTKVDLAKEARLNELPSDYSVVMLDKSGKILFEKKFSVPNILYTEAGLQQASTGPNKIKSDNVKFVVNLPSFKDVVTYKLINSSGSVLTEQSAEAIPPAPSLSAATSPSTPGVNLAASGSRINIAIVSANYSPGEMTKFMSDFEKVKSSFFSYDPLGANASSVNFIPVQNTNSLGCTRSAPPLERCLYCNEALSRSAVNSAGISADSIHVLVNDDTYGGCANTGVSYSYRGDLAGPVLTHELGHSLFGLKDEYTYGGNGPVGGGIDANCYSGTPPASEWSSIVAPGDYTLTCTYDNWYAPSRTSIMRDLSPFFNSVSKKIILQRFGVYTGSGGGSGGTPTPTPTITSGGGSKGTPTPTPTITNSGSKGTPTPTPTSSGSKGTPTPTPTITSGGGTGGSGATTAPTAPKVLGYERSCSTTGQISYKFNFTPGTGTGVYHKLQYRGVTVGDTRTDSSVAPIDQYNNYTSGTVIPPTGGNGFTPHIKVNYDILACNSVGCTPDPNHWWNIADTGDACSSSGSGDPCSTHGGIKSGTVAEGVCDKKIFNGTEAKKTVAEGNPYYGKTYELRYTCNDPGTYDYILPDTTKCSTTPWFDPPASSGGGSSELCDPSNPKEGCLCTSGACTATYAPIFSNWGCFISTWDGSARCCPNGIRYACSYGKCATNASACTTSSGGSTGTKTCYKDADGDGYGSSTDTSPLTNQSSCGAGRSENNTDCYDSNASANPGQSGNFYVDRGDGSFDYNCNNQIEKAYSTHSFGSTPTGTCQSTMPSGTVGFSNNQNCGTSGTFRLCYRWATTACGTEAESSAVADTIGFSCPSGPAGSGWALVDAASVQQNCK